MPKRLKVDKHFIPCEIADEDELYPNGIFVFNITKMIKYIQDNPSDFTIEEIAVSEISSFTSIDPSKLESIRFGLPVILAEISPGQYNLIDGHHRIEKARQIGKKNILAYKLQVHQHMKFLTNTRRFLTYIEFWNDKLKQFNFRCKEIELQVKESGGKT